MAENIENNGCSQRDNAEHEGYVKASRSFNRIWKERDSAQPRLLENKARFHTYVRVHSKSWKKFKSRLKELSSRKRCQSIKPSLEKIKVYARGWLNYYGIASMKSNIDDINGWLYHRIRMCIWKQWKKPRTKYKNLVKLGIPEHYASTIANSRRKYWYISNNKAVIWALNKERLINSGFYDLATAYQSVHVNY